MGLRIATNVESLSAQRSLGQVKLDQNKSLERLSSGTRITRAGDDAAGLAISENLKSDIRASRQATRNAGDGISLVQIAEGGLSEVSNILVRLRELSVQAASDTISDTDRSFSNMEFQQLTEEVERISQSTKFNGRSLLNGEGGAFEFQVGINNDEFNDRLKYQAGNINSTAAEIGVNNMSVGSKEAAQNNLEQIDGAIDKINGNRAELGALQNRLQSTINNLDVKTENLSAANSRIRDTDVAVESANLAKSNILMNSATSVLAQANNNGAAALKLVG